MKAKIKKYFLRLHQWAVKESQRERYLAFRRKYPDIDPSFRFNGDDINFYGDGNLSIGKNSYIGGGSTLQLTKSYGISIGTNCRISHNVRMYTSSALPDQDFNNHDGLLKRSGDIKIGNAVWIGVNVLINPGVTIGDNSIVGANSVVSKDVEPNAIVGGVPAKLIRFKNVDA